MNMINLAVFSKKRRSLLLLIEKEPRSLEDMENLLDISSASIKFHITKLVNSGLLIKEKGKYELSGMAVPVIKNLKELLESLTFYEKNLDYWTSNYFTSISNFLRKTIEELGELELIERNIAYLFRNPENNSGKVQRIKRCLYFFSCLHPEVSNLYPELAERGLIALFMCNRASN